MARKILMGIIVAMLLLIVGVIVLANVLNSPPPYQDLQEKLAQKLGVRIADYPDPIVFPEGYFGSVLKPDTSIQEVHLLVQGYEKAFRCSDSIEVYYYFSSEDAKAIRFVIFYNPPGTYKRLQGEDPNSRTIFVDGCVVGLINQ